jgi:hypothetical protein
MYNKKAQSQIITTILIILLVLAAIIVVWQVIQGTVQEGAEEIESQSSCLGLRLEITDITTEVLAVTGDSNAEPPIGAVPGVPPKIIIRPTKNIDSYQAYVNGAVFGAKGASLEALKTFPIVKVAGADPTQTISSGDEIEVIAIINEAACPGTKQKAP